MNRKFSLFPLFYNSASLPLSTLLLLSFPIFFNVYLLNEIKFKLPEKYIRKRRIRK